MNKTVLTQDLAGLSGSEFLLYRDTRYFIDSGLILGLGPSRFRRYDRRILRNLTVSFDSQMLGPVSALTSLQSALILTKGPLKNNFTE